MERLEGHEKTALWVITAGWLCGLQHPVEWAMQAWRTPGGTMGDDYYEEMKVVLPRLLCEFFEAERQQEPTVDLVKEWMEDHYIVNDYAKEWCIRQLLPLVAKYLEESDA